jgi:hypothetical protein
VVAWSDSLPEISNLDRDPTNTRVSFFLVDNLDKVRYNCYLHTQGAHDVYKLHSLRKASL